MFHPALVTVYLLSAEVSVNLMEIDAVVSGEQGLHELEVCPDLVNVAGAAGIVARCLDSAAEGVRILEPHDVVGLPAVQGYLLPLEGLDGLVGVYAKGCVTFLRNLIGLEDLCFFHFPE